MDLPIDLSSGLAIDGITELKQNIILVLKNERFEFFSNKDLGLSMSLHVDNMNDVETRIIKTIENLPDVKVKGITADENGYVDMSVVYKGDVVSYSFNIDELA